MNLRQKTLLIMTSALILIISILLIFSSNIFLNSYADIEKDHMSNDIMQATNAFNHDLNNLHMITHDWSAWDDTYTFIEDTNSHYLESNLIDETLIGTELNFILYFDTNGELVYGKAYSYRDEEPMDVPDGIQESLLAQGFLGNTDLIMEEHCGILMLPEGPVVIAQAPILKSDYSGPARGTLVMGKALDEEVISSLRDTVAIPLAVYSLNDPGIPQGASEAMRSSGDSSSVIFLHPQDGQMSVYKTLKDIYGNDALIIGVNESQDIYLQGKETVFQFILLLLGVGAILGGLTLLIIDRMVLSRLDLLSTNVTAMGTSGDFSARIRMNGNDEISILSTSINYMLDKINDVQKGLRESEERSRGIVNGQTELICRRKPDNTITYINDAYCSYLGMPAGELLGHRYQQDYFEEDRKNLLKIVSILTPQNPINSIIFRVSTPGGDIRWQSWIIRGIFDDDGELTEYQSVGRDITRQKLAEEAIRLANTKLNLLNSITRHDMLNQITGLVGYTSLALDEVSSDEMKSYLIKIEEISAKLQRQINFTRDYQELGVHGSIWHYAKDVTDQAIFQRDLGNIEWSVDLNDLEIYADPLFEKVFSNLVDNTIRHGGPDVSRILIYGHKSAEGYVLVYEDNGIGIPAEQKKRIFSSGFGKNLGYGLFLIREILGITGMNIYETGETGKGARFEIHIPKWAFRFSSDDPS